MSRLYLLLSALFLGYGEKKVAAAFFNGEMENELRDLGRLDMFGLMKEDNDREKVTSEMDKIRAKSVYDHPSADCSDACKERGGNNICLYQTISLYLVSLYTVKKFGITYVYNVHQR